MEQVALAGDLITITAAARRSTVACPACGQPSARIHSRYRRTLADLPWQGRRVALVITVRRFVCATADCRRRVFAEPLPATAGRYARRTTRAAAVLEALGFALGGRAAARLAARLGAGAAPNTILARVRAAASPPDGPAPAVRVLGVDDWALRRGQRYGTVLVDLERHRVIDLLPDREAATFAAWLTAHPGVEVISRDRGGAYAEGARLGAPSAVQIADRFHLLANLMEALERCCTRHHAALQHAAGSTHPKPLPTEETRRRRYSGLPNNRPGPTRAEQRGADRRARRLARYEQVVALRATGMKKARIARTLGLDRRTVDTWLAAGAFPERQPRARRAHPLDPHAAFLRERMQAGEQNAARLARALRGCGVETSDVAVRRYLAELRRRPQRELGTHGASGKREEVTGTVPSPRAPTPSPRETAWLLRKADATPDCLTAEETAYVDALCADCPEVAAARRHVAAFVTMLERRDGNALAPWLAAAEATELRSVAAGIRRDRDAVLAAILFTWSNGQVEGQVNRLKLVKRTMYGRAGFNLLRKRVLGAA